MPLFHVDTVSASDLLRYMAIIQYVVAAAIVHCSYAVGMRSFAVHNRVECQVCIAARQVVIGPVSQPR